MEDKRKVLIVDDEYDFCKSLKAYLDKAGFDASFTTNGEQALDMIKDNPPDAVTLDMRMPWLDGYHALKLIKEINPNVKIIIITAIAVEKMDEKLLAAGADAVFSKPVDLEDLVKRIHFHLKD